MGWWVSVVVVGAGLLVLVAAAMVPRRPAARLRTEITRLRVDVGRATESLRSADAALRARRRGSKAAPHA